MAITITNPAGHKGPGWYTFTSATGDEIKVRDISYRAAMATARREYRANHGTNFGQLTCTDGPTTKR